MALVAAAALLAWAWAAPPAAAHEGPGVLTVETDEATDTGRHYVVRLTWQNDGHPAARDTTLTATAFAPDGAPRTPVPMTALDDGRFEATVELPDPGRWRVNFTAVTPTASVDVQADAAPPSTATETDESTPSSTAPQADDTDSEAASSTRQDGDDGSSAGPFVAAGVLLVAAVAGAVVLVRRRARPTPDES